MGFLFALLAAATVLARVPRAGATEREIRQVRLRIRSWWIILVMFALAILGGHIPTVIFFAFVSFLALKEYLTVVPTRRADRSLLFFCYLANLVQYVWVAMTWYGMFIIFIPVYVFLLIPVFMVVAGETRGFLRAVGTLHWGMMSTVFALSHAAYLFMLPPSRAAGAGLVLYLVILTELNDVFQYLWGKSLGRRRIVPKVSSNKTWEGFVGGLVSTVVLSSMLAPLLTPLGGWGAVWFGMLIAAAGFFGDLAMSAIKRDLDIKDTSEYIPGHGGVLDRVDSLTYTAPLFFHLLRYVYFH